MCIPFPVSTNVSSEYFGFPSRTTTPLIKWFWNLIETILIIYRSKQKGRMRLIHILPLIFVLSKLRLPDCVLKSMLVKTFIWFHYKPTCSSRLRPTPNMYFSHLIWHFAFVQLKASHSLMTPLRACVINIDLEEKRKKRRRWRAERGRRERC